MKRRYIMRKQIADRRYVWYAVIDRTKDTVVESFTNRQEALDFRDSMNGLPRD